MKMIYQRTGGPLLSWESGYPPRQARAADTVALGAYEYTPNYSLPGAPEIIQGGIAGLTDNLSSVQSLAGMAIGAYHGYKRTGSVGWAAAWAVAGNVAPLITGVAAFVQGFAQPKSSAKRLRVTRG